MYLNDVSHTVVHVYLNFMMSSSISHNIIVHSYEHLCYTAKDALTASKCLKSDLSCVNI